MPRTISTACHTVHLDDMTGEGLLVRPHPADDLGNLHASDWTALLRDLYRQGWELSEDEHGDPCHVGYTEDGREMLGLYGRDPITSVPTVQEQAAAHRQMAV